MTTLSQQSLFNVDVDVHVHVDVNPDPGPDLDDDADFSAAQVGAVCKDF